MEIPLKRIDNFWRGSVIRVQTLSTRALKRRNLRFSDSRNLFRLHEAASPVYRERQTKHDTSKAHTRTRWAQSRVSRRRSGRTFLVQILCIRIQTSDKEDEACGAYRTASPCPVSRGHSDRPKYRRPPKPKQKRAKETIPASENTKQKTDNSKNNNEYGHILRSRFFS